MTKIFAEYMEQQRTFFHFMFKHLFEIEFCYRGIGEICVLILVLIGLFSLICVVIHELRKIILKIIYSELFTAVP